MEIQDKKLFGVFGYGDFGTPYLIGLGTDHDEAMKILKKEVKRWNYKLVEDEKDGFRNATDHSPESNEIDYRIRKLKVNTLL